MKQIFCPKCQSEEEKPDYLKSFMGYFITILAFTTITVGFVMGVSTSEIFSIGERMIVLFLTLCFCFLFLFIPYGFGEITKSYNLPIMKKYRFIGRFYFLPYLLMALYFGIILYTNGELLSQNLYYTANILFFFIWGFPLLFILINKLSKKKKK